MWIYAQSTGELLHDDDHHAVAVISIGYSGIGEGKNNPGLQQVHDVGPIPRGFWTIGAPECVNSIGPHGPFILPLTPNDGTETFGRSGFLVHGDSIQHSGSASHGCIILNRHVREQIAGSGDNLLKVIA